MSIATLESGNHGGFFGDEVGDDCHVYDAHPQFPPHEHVTYRSADRLLPHDFRSSRNVDCNARR